VHSVLFTSCVRFTRFGLAATLLTVLAFADLTMAGRGSGFSATCTAPPPMMAPPQVHAQSLAKATRTDISRTLFKAGEIEDDRQVEVFRLQLFRTDHQVMNGCKRVKHK
jgi:hypothetical protein